MMEYTGLHTGLNTPVRLSIQDGSIQAVETIEAEEDLPSRFQLSTFAPDGTSAVAEPASDSSR